MSEEAEGGVGRQVVCDAPGCQQVRPGGAHWLTLGVFAEEAEMYRHFCSYGHLAVYASRLDELAVLGIEAT